MSLHPEVMLARFQRTELQLHPSPHVFPGLFFLSTEAPLDSHLSSLILGAVWVSS